MQRLNRLAELVAFTPLGIGLGLILGVTSTFWVMTHLRGLHIEQPQAEAEVTAGVAVVPIQEPTAVAVVEPTLPPPQATPTAEPTARPKGAVYVVQEGDNLTHIVKRVCRSLGWQLYDYEPTLQMLIEQNAFHNRQYIGSTFMQPGDEMGISCVLTH
jgi:hypothetical protein